MDPQKRRQTGIALIVSFFLVSQLWRCVTKTTGWLAPPRDAPRQTEPAPR